MQTLVITPIAGFACKICNTVKPNYDELQDLKITVSDSFRGITSMLLLMGARISELKR